MVPVLGQTGGGLGVGLGLAGVPPRNSTRTLTTRILLPRVDGDEQIGWRDKRNLRRQVPCSSRSYMSALAGL